MSSHINHERPRYLVLGSGFVAQGYLRVLHYLGYTPVMVSRSWCDYTDPVEFSSLIYNYRPYIVINCAGYTGETVDDCQSNQTECYKANVELVEMIVKELNKSRTPLIHISSGCVFNGPGPFKETDAPDMRLWYQACKLEAEEIVSTMQKYWIFRIRMPFSHFPHKRNWLCKLMKYEKILDGFNSVTWLDEFCMRSWMMIQKGAPGIYHCTQPGPVSTVEVARKLKTDFAIYDPKDFLNHHIRRSEAVLDCSKFEGVYGTTGTRAISAIEWCIGRLTGLYEQSGAHVEPYKQGLVEERGEVFESSLLGTGA